MRLTEEISLIASGELGLSSIFDCHVYVVQSSGEACLIDSGSGLDTGGIIHNIIQEDISPETIKYLFLTHVHPDHAGGAAEMRELLGCKVVCSARENSLLEQGTDVQIGLDAAKRAGRYPPNYAFRHSSVDEVWEDHDSFAVGKLYIKPIHTPGHSKGSTCYLVNTPLVSLFSGDTLFHGGRIGLLNQPGCDITDYREKLGRLAHLGVEALLPGHGLFTVRHGQAHVDEAIRRLRKPDLRLVLPESCQGVHVASAGEESS